MGPAYLWYPTDFPKCSYMRLELPRERKNPWTEFNQLKETIYRIFIYFSNAQILKPWSLQTKMYKLSLKNQAVFCQ